MGGRTELSGRSATGWDGAQRVEGVGVGAVFDTTRWRQRLRSGVEWQSGQDR